MLEKKFKLKEIVRKEKEDGDSYAYKYLPTNVDDEKEISINVKTESMAKSYGLPTNIGDTISIDFGIVNKQKTL